MIVISYLKHVTLLFFFCFFFVETAQGATISFSDETEEKYMNGDTYKKMLVHYTFANVNEKGIVIRRHFANGIKSDFATLFSNNGTTGTSSSQKWMTFNTSGDKSVTKVEYFVRMADNRLAPLTTYNVGGSPPTETTINPPSMTTKPQNNGMEIDLGVPGLTVDVTDDNGDSVTFGSDGGSRIKIPLANSSNNSQHNFTWEFFDGKHIRFDFDGAMDNLDATAYMGTMEGGVFVPLPYKDQRFEGSTPYETDYEPNAPDGGYYIKIDIEEDGTGDVLESHIFDTNGEVGAEQNQPFPYTVTAKDDQGNTYEWQVNEDGSLVPIHTELFAPENPPEYTEDGDPPTGGGGDTGGGTQPGTGTGTGGCIGCDLLKCPGWDQIADKIGSAVAGKLPPPPNWPEVAKIFGDELVPRIGQEIENRLGHPDPPPPVSQPQTPVFNGTSGVQTPTPQDSVTEPSQPVTFDPPNIPVDQDTTGGIDLSVSDPTDQIPHTDPNYKPEPGKETGGTKPQQKTEDPPKPAEKPYDWYWDYLDQLPKPNNSSSEPPKPNTQNSDPPKPQIPMPGGGE